MEIQEYDSSLSGYLDKSEVVILLISATWCPACKKYAPTVKSVSSHTMFKRVRFFNVDVDKDKHKEIPKKHGIKGIPTILILKDGKMVKKIVGSKLEEDLKEAISSVVNS